MMYVLCTMVALSLKGLLKGQNKKPELLALDESPSHKTINSMNNWTNSFDFNCMKNGNNEIEDEDQNCEIYNLMPGHVKPAQRHFSVYHSGVMLSTRKTWDVGHTPCLQEIWKNMSLDTSEVEFLMTEEEEKPILPLQSSPFQCKAMTMNHSEQANNQSQEFLIQSLQEKLCQFQARFCSEESNRRLQIQLMRKAHEQNINEKLALIKGLQDVVTEQEAQLRKAGTSSARRSSLGSRPVPSIQRLVDSLHSAQQEKIHLQEDLLSLQDLLRSRENEQQAMIGQLRNQVEDLKKKLKDQAQELNHFHSKAGATDLEKHLQILESENEQLKQDLTSCQDSLKELHSDISVCVNCLHEQDVKKLQAKLFQLNAYIKQKDQMLLEVQKELDKKSGEVLELHVQLENAIQHKDEITNTLQDCQLALSRHAAQPVQIKYITKTIEVESPHSKQSLSEAVCQNKYLQEQTVVQRQLVKDLEQQLQESQRTVAQLRAQVMLYETEIERTRGELVDEMQSLEEEKNRVIEEAFVRAESEMKAVHENLAGVRANLMTLQPALRTLTSDYNCLKRQVQDFPSLLERAIGDAKQEICQVIEKVNSVNQELLRKYKREMALRKKCHNELVRLKGNIRVFCRVRPLNKEDGDDADTKNVVVFDTDDDAVMYVAHKGKSMNFELDKVFPPEASQENVFQEVRALVTSCIDGYNVCIFAYGQTGSGKTYTMEGVPENPGINQRALRLLFAEVKEKDPEWKFVITVSMVEIYNETIRNLLGDNLNEKLEIKLCPDGSGQLYVPGLTEFTVESVEDINKVFDLGYMNRATACTNLNEHSSRSHALLIVTVNGLNVTTGTRTSGKLNLVDLAGSERIAKSGAEGSRLREAQCINKSLAALGDVIHALRTKQGHIPFRNSKLTYLLQDSLSGDSKTLMMVQISPAEKNVSESICSLKFAQRVRSVELGPQSRKVETSSVVNSSNSVSPSLSPTPTQESTETDLLSITPALSPTVRGTSTLSTFSPGIGRTWSSTRRKPQISGKPRLVTTCH
ncbi:kinesin-like protein KIFC3 isoform X3 [Erpetoichthys calabaricus]|uniref:kinesin-like protein KIFC3 isoform X3 n=1 Tax=Erpetoichthys calabaricus TaxID=27687 RepID=UPI002234E22E|nr:kinesin-like protein KIFC3 isoform X3 [Erpetoichthys calabaricus]